MALCKRCKKVQGDISQRPYGYCSACIELLLDSIQEKELAEQATAKGSEDSSVVDNYLNGYIIVAGGMSPQEQVDNESSKCGKCGLTLNKAGRCVNGICEFPNSGL